MPRRTKTDVAEALGSQIGTAIKSARAKARLTQFELAELLEIEVTTLSRIENGSQMPSLERLNSIAAVLNVPLVSLLWDEQTPDAWDQAAVEAMRVVPVRDRQFVLDFIHNFAAHNSPKRSKTAK